PPTVAERRDKGVLGTSRLLVMTQWDRLMRLFTFFRNKQDICTTVQINRSTGKTQRGAGRIAEKAIAWQRSAMPCRRSVSSLPRAVAPERPVATGRSRRHRPG